MHPRACFWPFHQLWGRAVWCWSATLLVASEVGEDGNWQCPTCGKILKMWCQSRLELYSMNLYVNVCNMFIYDIMLYEFMRSSQKLCQKNHNYGFKLQSKYIYTYNVQYIYTIIWLCFFFFLPKWWCLLFIKSPWHTDGQVLWAGCTTATSMELRVLRLTLNRSMRATPPASVMIIHGADWFLGSFLAHPKQERD